MTFTFSPQLINKAVEEVAEKHRATSRAREEIIQNVARQRVASALEHALRHHKENSLPQCTAIDSDIAKKVHRAALIFSFTMVGVSHTTAERIVDKDILCV